MSEDKGQKKPGFWNRLFGSEPEPESREKDAGDESLNSGPDAAPPDAALMIARTRGSLLLAVVAAGSRPTDGTCD